MDEVQGAADAVAAWWAEQLKGPLGRETGETDLLKQWLALLVAEHVPRAGERAKAFCTALASLLVEQIQASSDGFVWTEVDYHPDPTLIAACERSGVDPAALPHKSHAYIRRDGGILCAYAKRGYGVEDVQIHPTKTEAKSQ